ncbi:Ribosomal protein S12 methylthiotransferase RimO [Allorhodopirellula solitaria]|uniref:Ribosomal protein S12 methylthiotransferase RimO n=2 Tax=Allorhodopirellula solitaria TaxID=2527987 RepID=A0A5C5YJY5_9BACT|nr:Ribosomal protein S12 methylthiotransferase RimO [Allorhodopirellula solitaria]
MSGLRVGHSELLARGMSLPGLSRRASALSQLPPLGLLTIAATAPPDWQVSLVSDDGVGDESAIAAQIQSHQPDIVAFSCLTPAADRAARISELIRSQPSCRDQVVTVVGGLHATAAPDWCQTRFDVVTCGDGESTLPRVLADFAADRLQHRYRADGSYALAQSPTPRWELLGPEAPPRYTLQTMRGCPWACSFCAASRLLGPARTKSDQQIERELAAIARIRPRPWLELADDNTFASDRDHGPMLDALRRYGARWFTESDWRIALRPDLLRQIAASGCRQILIGLESSVFRYGGMGAKTADWQRMIDAVEAIQSAGIVVNACFIVGADGETPASIERLGDFLETAPMGEVQLTLQTPFPGTSLYDSLQANRRLLPGDFSCYTLFDVVYRPDQMTADELQNAFHELISRVFRDDAQQRRDLIQKSIRAIARRQ